MKISNALHALVARKKERFYITISGQETERVYSYNPKAQMGLTWLKTAQQCWARMSFRWVRPVPDGTVF